MGKKFYHQEKLDKLFDVQDKETNAIDIIEYTLERTNEMFKWNGLPETIPQEFLEMMLQINGFTVIAENDNKLYAYIGGLGGEPDQLYRPTIATIANPAQKLSKTFTIKYDKIGDGDCILVKNDLFMKGLTPLIKKYAVLLAENELSIWDAEINTRIISILTASDGNTKAAADEYIKKILKGDLSAIFDQNFGEDGIRTQPYASSNTNGAITQLIELEQYLRGTLFNELGLQSNWNAKRESISSSESQLNEDMLLPLIDHMLKMRKQAADEINELFGTNITVELNSVWEDNQEQVDAEIEAIKNGDMTSDESNMEDAKDEILEDEEENKEDDAD